MRTISFVATATLMLSGFALWLPLPTPLSMSALSQHASIEPSLSILAVGVELICQNLAVKTILTVGLIWAGCGLLLRTATLTK